MHVAPRAVQDSRSSISNSAEFTVTHRLLRGDGFDRVIHAENISDIYFRVFFVSNGMRNARLGIIASKKILPSAVHRNHVKRIIREVFRQHKIKTCKLDLVVMVKRAYAQTHEARSDNLKTLFNQAENRCAEL